MSAEQSEEILSGNIGEHADTSHPESVVLSIGTHRGPFNLELNENGTELRHRRVGAGGVAPSIGVLVQESPIPIKGTPEWHAWVNTPHTGWFTEEQLEKLREEQGNDNGEETSEADEDDEPGGLSEGLRAAIAEVKEKLDIIVVPNVPSRRNLKRYKDTAQEFWRINHGLLEFSTIGPDWAENFAGYRKVNYDLARNMARDAMRNASANPEAGIILRFDDYQVQLGPAEARKQLASFNGYKRIGYFHHTPFATSDELARIPENERKEILRGILGADLVGFHTKEWVSNFIACLDTYLKDEVEILMYDDKFVVKHDERLIKVEDFPIGIDVDSFAAVASRPDVVEGAQKMREDHPDKQLIYMNGRGDPIKGLVEAEDEYDILLGEYSEHRGQVVMRIRAPKSRKGVPENAAVDRQLKQGEENINRRWGDSSTGYVPLELHQTNVGPDQLAMEYKSSDVLVARSIRDGYILVVDEYMICGPDNGVTAVSTGAGSSNFYPSALLLSPSDQAANVETLHTALIMSEPERRARAEDNRRRAYAKSNRVWARNYMNELME